MNRRVFFRGLGWDGDGGSGRERTSPPRLIYRGTDELTGDRGTGDLDTQGNFTFPPSHFVRPWLQETLGTKSLHETFRVSHNLPCQEGSGWI